MKTRLLLATLILVNAAWLAPELHPPPDLNDNVLHFTLIRGMTDQMEHGRNPLDFWTPEIALGEPIARLYQPLSHLMVAALYFVCFKTIPLMTLFIWFRFLALVLLPLSFYGCARLISLQQSESFACALLSFLVSGDAFGLDYGSYVWSGHGLFPQLVATHLLLWTVGIAWKQIEHNSPRPTLLLSSGMLAAIFYANVCYGYAGAVCLVLMALVRSRVKAVSWILLPAGLMIASKVWIWFDDAQYFSPHGWPLASGMQDSYGAVEVLKRLFTGQVFDGGRLPMLSLLVLSGIVYVLFRHDLVRAFLLTAFPVFLLLYFGRPFWGSALWLFGIPSAMQMHRFIGLVQMFGMFLAGIAFNKLWQACEHFWESRLIATCLLLLYLAIPAQERFFYLKQNAQWSQRTRTAFAAEQRDIDAAFQLVKVRGGRAYAGLPAQWGNQFKVGDVPFYSLFPINGIPCVGYEYLGFFPANDEMYRFREVVPEDYARFNVRTVVAPITQLLPAFLKPVAGFGRFILYATPADNTGYFDSHGAKLYVSTDFTAWVEGPAHLTYRMTWHPNWTAKSDQTTLGTFAESDGFIGFQVPSGTHLVTMAYR